MPNIIDPTTTIRSFLTTYHKAHLEPTTASDYLVQVNHFERYFASWLAAAGQPSRAPQLGDLTVGHIHGAIAWQLGRGRTKSTADKLRRALLALWNKASELSEGGFGPPGRIRGLKKPDYAAVAWTIEEFGRLLYGCSLLRGRVGPFTLSAWMSALCWTVYNSGSRVSAAMDIRRTWVNVTSRRLVMDPSVEKDDEGRSIGLLPDTMNALLPLLANGKDGPFDDWPYDRNVVQWPALTDRLKQAIVLAGLAENESQITRRDLWHKIRRTYATQIYIATGSIEA